jgi:hypothetical protein
VKFPFPPLPSARKPILLQACRNQAVMNCWSSRGHVFQLTVPFVPHRKRLAGKKNGLTLVTPARSGEEESQTLTAYRGSYGRCERSSAPLWSGPCGAGGNRAAAG